MALKILIIGNRNYLNWIENYKLVDDIKEANLVFFTGGEDVDPGFYNEPRHKYTYSNIDRDVKEIEIFNKAQELGIKTVGVCRGSQFLCTRAGGRLIQHQSNPGVHLMDNYEGDPIFVTSTHHQAAFPFNLPYNEYKILGWTEDLLGFHEDGLHQEMNPFVECEVVYYPKINSLGIQPHPEMMWDSFNNQPYDKYIKSIEWFRNTLNNFLNNKL